MNAKKKIMPPEAAEQLDRIERIKAHLENDYELLEEDREYFDRLNIVFKLTHGEENPDVAMKKITAVLGAGDHSSLIDDCSILYGDFFTINGAAMRVIQEKRHERVYEAAMSAQDFASAEQALKAIDNLYRLYNDTDDLPISNRRLPGVKLTSNTEALQILLKNNGMTDD